MLKIKVFDYFRAIWLPLMGFGVVVILGFICGYAMPGIINPQTKAEITFYYDTIIKALPQADFNLSAELKNVLLLNCGLLALLWLRFSCRAYSMTFPFP